MNINRLITIISATLSISAGSAAYAQEGIGEALSLVEKNNMELKALRMQTEADKYGYKAEASLDNPEVGFDYLWGSPADIGRRKDFSVTQSLDLAVLSGVKGRLRSSRSALADMRYAVERQRILLEAKKLCISLTYCNALEKELAARLRYAEEADSSLAVAFRSGEVSARESNEAHLALLSARSAYGRNAIERESCLSGLRRLNAGEDVPFTDDAFARVETLPEDFEAWYGAQAGQSPVLAYIGQAVKVEEQEMKTSKMSNAPHITAGYMSELVAGEDFRGLTIGLSIPLWSVRSSVRQANASYKAAAARQQDAAAQYYSEMGRLYAEALGLQRIAEDYRNSLDTARNSGSLIRQRYHAGDISLIDYISEMRLYYDTLYDSLAAERDLRLALAELQANVL